MTEADRRVALEQIATEVRDCTRCRLHEGRTRAVPGEGNPDTEVVFVGEGPGFNEDREGRPFVGRAGALLVRLLGSVGWGRDDVFITNVVKCRPPENRDPQPDEIAACAPYLRRQLEVLDPALVVTLGRYSMGTFMPGARISQAHGTVWPVDPATGAGDALVYAMYHPAAALRATEVERQSFNDMAGVPRALLQSRERRAEHAAAAVSIESVEPVAMDIVEEVIADISDSSDAVDIVEEPIGVDLVAEPVAIDVVAEPVAIPLAQEALPMELIAFADAAEVAELPDAAQELVLVAVAVPNDAVTPPPNAPSAAAAAFSPTVVSPAAIAALTEPDPGTDQLTLF